MTVFSGQKSQAGAEQTAALPHHRFGHQSAGKETQREEVVESRGVESREPELQFRPRPRPPTLDRFLRKPRGTPISGASNPEERAQHILAFRSPAPPTRRATDARQSKAGRPLRCATELR